MTVLAAALTDILNPDLDVRTAVDSHFSEDYRQRTDGVWSDRGEFVEHIEHLRQVVRLHSVEVIDELIEGALYAERHVVRLDKRTGERVEQEVYVFGEREGDGRLRRIEETTLMLIGQESDRGIARAR